MFFFKFSFLSFCNFIHIHQDPVREIKRINDFLGTGRSEELLQQIAESCDFKNMKKADAEIKEYDEKMKKQMPLMYRKGIYTENSVTVDCLEKNV
jgi:hypothetical protein